MELAKTFKALADPNRLRAFAAVQEHELCVCQIVELLKLAPSTVSKHMSLLHDAGLVQSSKRGKWVYYSMTRETANPMHQDLIDLVSKLLADLPTRESDNQALVGIVAAGPEKLCK